MNEHERFAAKDSSLLPAIRIETAPLPQWSVIWLHGLGADGHDFEPIVDEMSLDSLPAIRFIFPMHRCGR